MFSFKNVSILYIYIVGIGDVIPPVIIHAVFNPNCLREMVEPPGLKSAVIAVAPFGAVHTASTACEIRKTQPIVACAIDLSLIAPIVVLLTVRREMNQSDPADLFVDIRPYAQRKMEAFKQHRSQFMPVQSYFKDKGGAFMAMQVEAFRRWPEFCRE